MCAGRFNISDPSRSQPTTHVTQISFYVPATRTSIDEVRVGWYSRCTSSVSLNQVSLSLFLLFLEPQWGSRRRFSCAILTNYDTRVAIPFASFPFRRQLQ